MDIKLGVLGSETTFHYVNILVEENKAKTEHVTIAGTVKMQEAANGFNTYSMIWLCLTKAEKNSLLVILNLSSELNLQMEDDGYSNHTVKFRSPVSSNKSLEYPGNYEVIADCIEVT